MNRIYYAFPGGKSKCLTMSYDDGKIQDKRLVEIFDNMQLAEFFSDFKKKQYLKLMYVWGHSYEFDRDNNWKVIEEFCNYMGGHDDIWHATNIEIIDYMDAAKRLMFSTDNSFVYNPNIMDICLDVNGEYINVKGGTTVFF